jgi:hypothetical protein
MIRDCSLCGRPVRTDATGTYRKATGWVPQRAGGGGNQVALAVRHDEWAHGECVKREGRGISAQQDSLGDV